MRYGLHLACGGEEALAREAEALLARQMIPLAVRTDAPCGLSPDEGAFLRTAARTLLRPGEAISARDVTAYLSGAAYPGNVVRRYVNLQLSLVPYLRMNDRVMDTDGGHFLGESLLAAHLMEDGRVDAALPGGVWTDMLTGGCYAGARLRLMRPANMAPLLAAPGAVIPVGVNDRSDDYDPADRVTLHWYQPEAAAEIRLHTGETYRLTRQGDGCACETDSTKPFHLIVHRDGEETLVR